MPMCSCIICKKEYSNKGIFTHYERSHNNSTKYSSGYNGKYKTKEYTDNLKKAQKNRFDKKIGELKKFAVCCDKCKSSFYVEEREFKFPSKQKYFCSRSCANSRDVSFEQKQKTSKSLLGKLYKKEVEVKSVCLNCEEQFEYTVTVRFEEKIKKKKFCSKSCSCKYRNKNIKKSRSGFQNYYSDCKFKFNVYEYPEEFELSLIEEFGWYKAKNKGNNLFGISRDHMISVRYGFDNNIPPKHIAHPANCQLMQHNYNSSKHSKCSLSYEELLERIEKWENKYNKF